jgi:hypothetical protein
MNVILVCSNQHGDIVALMDIFAHESYGNIPEQSEASFGELDPQRLNFSPIGLTNHWRKVSGLFPTFGEGSFKPL